MINIFKSPKKQTFKSAHKRSNCSGKIHAKAKWHYPRLDERDKASRVLVSLSVAWLLTSHDQPSLCAFLTMMTSTLRLWAKTNPPFSFSGIGSQQWKDTNTEARPRTDDIQGGGPLGGNWSWEWDSVCCWPSAAWSSAVSPLIRQPAYGASEFGLPSFQNDEKAHFYSF